MGSDRNIFKRKKMKKSLGRKTIAYPLPVYLVGSYDENGQANIMTAAWGGVVCSEPAALGVSVRASRLTHSSILKNKAFTISFPSAKLVKAVDFAGLVSGSNYDKFEKCSLKAIKSDLVAAPYVAQCPVVAELSLVNRFDLGSHTLFIGQVEDVKADEEVLGPNGLEAEKIDPLIYFPSQKYFRLGDFAGQAFSIGLSRK